MCVLRETERERGKEGEEFGKGGEVEFGKR